MRRRAKVDSNHAEIVDALRKAGCSVQSLAAVGKGCPDLLVGLNGINVLLEVKTEKGATKPGQLAWMGEWRGRACLVRSAEQAIQAVRLEAFPFTVFPVVSAGRRSES